MGTREDVIADCAPLIAEARESGMMLFARYQQLWFTPDELDEAQAKGRFLWGALNWRLRPTSEYLAEAERALEAARKEHERRVAKCACMSAVLLALWLALPPSANAQTTTRCTSAGGVVTCITTPAPSIVVRCPGTQTVGCR